MLHKCANSRCSNLFRKMNEGRLFQLPQSRASGEKNLRHAARHGFEYFWLCDQCRLFFTLSFRPDSGVVVVPLPGLATGKIPQVAAKSSATEIQAVLGEIQWNA
jgi:hypothetical protein